MKTNNWKSNKWFGKYIAPQLTPEFKEWWVDTFGTEKEWLRAEDDGVFGSDGYWLRCSYAWHGWEASDRRRE